MLRASDSPLKIKVFFWLTDHHVPKVHYTYSGELNAMSVEGFRALGPGAASAVPALSGLLDKRIKDPTTEPELLRGPVLALDAIGPDAKAAVPLLLKITASTNAWVRDSVYSALGDVQAEPSLAIPALMTGLQDPWAMNREHAAMRLGGYHGEAKAAFPMLLAMLNDPNVNLTTTGSPRMDVRQAIKSALKAIDPEMYDRVVTNAAASFGEIAKATW